MSLQTCGTFHGHWHFAERSSTRRPTRFSPCQFLTVPVEHCDRTVSDRTGPRDLGRITTPLVRDLSPGTQQVDDAFVANAWGPSCRWSNAMPSLPSMGGKAWRFEEAVKMLRMMHSRNPGSLSTHRPLRKYNLKYYVKSMWQPARIITWNFQRCFGTCCFTLAVQ